MNRNFKILYKTFSFLLVIPILLLIEYIFPEFKASIGFCIGWIIGNIANRFWSKPLYVENIKKENNILTITYSNPLLKKGIEKYNIEMISDFRIKKPIFLIKYGEIRFKFDDLNKKYVYLNTDRKMIFKEIDGIDELKKLHTTPYKING